MIKKLFRRYFYKWDWVPIFWSPFIKPEIICSFGAIKHGLPYFFPRKWVNHTKKSATLAALNEYEQDKTNKYRKYISIEDRIKYFRRCKHAVPVKYLWLDVIGLGWKTKWGEFRHEWPPMISLVILKRQLYIEFTLKSSFTTEMSYWEAWLTYNNTDKNLSKKERLFKTFNEYSCTWTSKGKSTDHYYKILKKKYIPVYEEWRKLNIIN